ncbi:MAG: hypothetical protein IJ475_02120 [Bacilli bacterium]|nr:hypothetical protein [Bacilli bacterium]
MEQDNKLVDYEGNVVGAESVPLENLSPSPSEQGLNNSSGQNVLQGVSSMPTQVVSQTISVDGGVNQGQSFDNSFNQAFGVNSVQDVSSNGVQVVSAEVEQLEDGPVAVLDPHNNANNPIPVNPVAPMEEEIYENIDMPFSDVVKMTLGIFLRPASNIKENAKKYSEMHNCLKFTLIITVLSIVLSLVGCVVVGGFNITIDPLTGGYTRGFSLDNILQQNFLSYIVKGVLISGIGIFVVSLVYYASSFMNNKGVKFGTYLMISNLSFLPFILGCSLLMPITCIFSTYIGLCLMVICILYMLVIYITGVNEILAFQTVDRKVFYNLFNFSLIFIIIMVLFYVLLESGLIYLPVSIAL